jgi:hypothetical protein
MSSFMLILHDKPKSFAGISPADMQRVIGEYVGWRNKMNEAGRLGAGQKLKDEGGKWLTSDGGKMRVVDGPYAEAKEVVGGYYLIEADDYAHMVKLCEGHPHLKYGGRIEVREIDVR